MTLHDYGRSGGRFFQWWFGELSALVPRPVRRVVSGDARTLILESGKATPRLALQSRGATESLGEIEGHTSEEKRQRLRELLRKCRRCQSRILRIADDQILRKTLRLPLAAMENLREVVGFELDRQTPFGSRDVYFHCYPVKAHQDAARIDVAVVLVPKRIADEAMALAREWGFTPDRVTAKVKDGEVTLLAVAGGGQRLVRGAFAVLLVLTFCLSIVAAGLPLWKKQQALAGLEARMEGALAAARATTVLQERVAAYEDIQRVLSEKQRAYSPRSLLLAELTRRLPDGSYLTRLTLDDERVWMTGFAESASGLIRRFEDSPLLQSVTFESPVERDAESLLERFTISSRLAEGESP